MGRICLIDGDVLCYSACPPRMGDELFIHLDSKGRKTEKEFSEEEDRRYLEASWERFKKSVPELLDRLFCNEYMMAVKGDYNFRNTVYPDYKMNRHTSDKIRATAFVPAIRELAVIEDLKTLLMSLKEYIERAPEVVTAGYLQLSEAKSL